MLISKCRRTDRIESNLPESVSRSIVVVVQLLSHIQLFVTTLTTACQASLSYTVSWSLLRLMSIELVMPSNLSSSVAPSPLPSIFPIRLSADFSAETLLARREWHDIFEVMKMNNLQLRILYLDRSFGFDGEIKLYRQAKAKRIQHHQTSVITHPKGIL